MNRIALIEYLDRIQKGLAGPSLLVVPAKEYRDVLVALFSTLRGKDSVCGNTFGYAKGSITLTTYKDVPPPEGCKATLFAPDRTDPEEAKSLPAWRKVAA